MPACCNGDRDLEPAAHPPSCPTRSRIGHPTRNAYSFDNQSGGAVSAGLSYYRNRSYDPQTGRWTQEDPVGVAGGANLYAYVGNDPVNVIDPFGLECPPKPGEPPCIDPIIVTPDPRIWPPGPLIDMASTPGEGRKLHAGRSGFSLATQEALAETAQCLASTASAVLSGVTDVSLLSTAAKVGLWGVLTSAEYFPLWSVENVPLSATDLVAV